MSKSLTLVFSIVGVGLAILSLIVSLKAIKSSERIALDSGAYDRPIPVLSLGNFDLQTTDNCMYELFYLVDVEDGDQALAELPLCIKNVGNKDLEDIKVTIQFNSVSNLLIADSSYFDYISPISLDHRRDFKKNSEAVVVLHELSKLTPNVRLKIPELIKVVSTSINSKTLDGFDVSIAFSISFSVFVTASDVRAQRCDFEISFIQGIRDSDVVDEHFSRLDRDNSMQQLLFLVSPLSETLFDNDSIRLIQYVVPDESIRVAHINPKDDERVSFVPIYDGYNQLEELRMYDSEGNLTEVIPMIDG